MANIPIRDMGALGLILDRGPHDLPLNAWSGGNNVMFSSGAVRRAPAFRTLQDLSSVMSTPAHIMATRPASGADSIFVVNKGGKVWQYTPGTGLTDVTIAGFAQTDGENQFTSALLSNVLYLNRETHPIRYRDPSTGEVKDLPQWPSTYRANLIRPFKDFLFAFGINKAGSEYLTTFKWSNRVTAGNIPDTWDPTIISDNLAGETTLAALDGPIIDAGEMRDHMLIYGPNQVWAVEFTGDRLYPFAQRRLFGEGGSISRNCAVEIAGKHYVFGADDFYVHDGVEKQSIATGRIRSWVFKSMNRSKAHKFFVSHDRTQRMLMFCFISQDDRAYFTGTEYPNRAALFSYESNTWGMMDLPNVSSMATGNAASVLAWSGTSDTWGSIGGSWGDLEDGRKDTLLVATNPVGSVTTARVHALDTIDYNSRVVAPLDTAATRAATVERTGIDMDEAQLPLNYFKIPDTIYPQMKTYRSLDMTVEVGATTLQQGDPSYDDGMTFDPTVDYAVNSTSSGRYCAIRITEPEPCDFEITGMDIDVKLNGQR